MTNEQIASLILDYGALFARIPDDLIPTVRDLLTAAHQRGAAEERERIAQDCDKHAMHYRRMECETDSQDIKHAYRMLSVRMESQARAIRATTPAANP